MKKHSKRYNNIKISDKALIIEQALKFIQDQPKVKFNETLEAHFKLNLNKKEKQVLRGTVKFPKSFGKEKAVLVFCSTEKIEKMKSLGAKYAGAEDLVKKIQEDNKIIEEVDVVLAEPVLMREVAKLGRILGPKGLMPSPKNNTIQEDLEKAMANIQEGTVSFKSDETGIIHQAFGKMNFDLADLKKNFLILKEAVMQTREEESNKKLIDCITICSTMGKGVKVII